MSKVLILFAHPRLQNSTTHARLIGGLDNMPKVTFHDLYEAYPDFDIDVAFEQEMLSNHDIFILQFPLYWYSSPPIIKQWIDLVLEHGWAYGHNGKALAGKKIMVVISTGGKRESYQKGGFNKFSIREFLAPFEQTARLCNMEFLPPFVVHGTHLATSEDIDKAAESYHLYLKKLTENKVDFGKIAEMDFLEEISDSLFSNY